MKNNNRPEYCMLPKKVCFKIEFHGKTLVAEIYRIQQLKKSVLLKEVICRCSTTTIRVEKIIPILII